MPEKAKRKSSQGQAEAEFSSPACLAHEVDSEYMFARPRLGLKRAYDPPAPSDGRRVLVDRIWPRGLKREDAAIDLWLKEAAPSAELRRWFKHDPAKWDEFCRRYWAELDNNQEAVARLKECAGAGSATLVYGAKDPEHNNAVALKIYLERR